NVLNKIKDAVQDSTALISDINQIIGLKEKLDANAFIPFQASDFSPETGKKICSYSDIIDNVIEKLKSRNRADNKNGSLMRTGQKYGYTNYFRLDNRFICALSVLFNTWQGDAGTFFWFSTGSNKKEDGGIDEWIEAIANKFTPHRRCYRHPNAKSGLFLPIFVPFDKVEDEVVDDMAKQIEKIADILNDLSK
ncbi:MAG: hypothetical protein LBP87_14865, partial [Planctomycetaceae bacterium]|nr:hypothetical protein [Planctomycetaceae bacterium]